MPSGKGKGNDGKGRHASKTRQVRRRSERRGRSIAKPERNESRRARHAKGRAVRAAAKAKRMEGK